MSTPIPSDRAERIPGNREPKAVPAAFVVSDPAARREIARRLYCEEGVKTGAIARALGMSRRGVCDMLRRLGVKPRPPERVRRLPTPADPERWALLVELYLKLGWGREKIGRLFGCNPQTVARLLGKGGVVRPKPARSKPPVKNPGARRHRWPSRVYSFIRTVTPTAVQARGFLSKTDIVNLGIFHSRAYGSMEGAYRAANRAGREFAKRMAWAPRPDPWDVIRELQATVVDGRPIVPLHVLPKWVYRHKDGTGYGAKAGTRRDALHLPGPYPTPEAAHAAMRERKGRAA